MKTSIQKLTLIGSIVLFSNHLFAQCHVGFNITVDSNNYATITDTAGGTFQFCTCCIGINYGDPGSGLFNTSYSSGFFGLNHFYKYPGNYTVCTMPGFCSCPDPADIVCKQITIADTGGNCQADFCYTATDTNGFLEVSFINTSSADDSITDIIWDFNDGMHSSQYNVTHAFFIPVATQLTYLSIQTQNGCQSSIVDTIRVGTSCTLELISGAIITETGLPIPGTTITLSGDDIQTEITDTTGRYHFTVARGGNYTVTPFKSNDVVFNNGITSIDVLLTRRHFLGTPLSTPYKIIAADVDSSNSVSTLDILLMRSMILQNINAFPNGLWSFVPANHVFADSLHPFPFPTSITYSNLQQSIMNQDFIGIKLGDVNDSWDAEIP